MQEFRDIGQGRSGFAEKRMGPEDASFLAQLEKNHNLDVHNKILRLKGPEKELAQREQNLNESLLVSNDPLFDAEENRDVFNLWCPHNSFLDQCDECRSRAVEEALVAKQKYDETLKEYENDWVNGGNQFQDESSASMFLYHEAILRAREEYVQELLRIRNTIMAASQSMK